MTYLPKDYTNDTNFPRAFGKDLEFQARITREQYQRQMPLIEYFCLLLSETPGATSPEVNDDLVGGSGTTVMDDLYGESHPGTAGTAWQQPHGTEAGVGASLSATDPELFSAVELMNGRVKRESRENELKKLGFDRARALIVTFPTSILDDHGVTVKPGDQFVWDGDRYVVRQEDSGGYWKNTNIRLFRTLSCEHVHAGS